MTKQPFNKLTGALDKAVDSIKKGEKHLASGRVVWAKDGVIYIENLPGVTIDELVEVVDAGCTAIVLQIVGETAYAALLENNSRVKSGSQVSRLGFQASFEVSDDILGRVINPLGEAEDGLAAIKNGKRYLLERPAPSVMEREPVSVPLQTGILAIDALIPIGRGQRELIIGDRQTGKTTIAVDTILNQKDQDIICVYVSIGQRDGKTAQVIRQLKEGGAMKYTVVVTAAAAAPAAVQYLAPYAGSAVAEYFMDQGKDVLIVYDDLTKHAVSYRELSLLLRKPPGREAYPGDVFYIHSRLLERAARRSQEFGGGSITALPIIETQAADVSAYIPTNVISITDGQIFLEPKLFNKGIRPAVNVGISVSRVGGAAQTKLMKKVAGPAKLTLAQYEELAAFAQFASELDESSKQQLLRGERLTETLKQGAGKPWKLWQQILILQSAMDGRFDGFETQKIQSIITDLLTQAESKLKEVIPLLNIGKELSKESDNKLRNFTDGFFKQIS